VAGNGGVAPTTPQPIATAGEIAAGSGGVGGVWRRCRRFRTRALTRTSPRPRTRQCARSGETQRPRWRNWSSISARLGRLGPSYQLSRLPRWRSRARMPKRAKQLLWDDFAQYVRSDRASEVGATESMERTVSVEGGLSMRYYLARRGEQPPTGRSLFISMPRRRATPPRPPTTNNGAISSRSSTAIIRRTRYGFAPRGADRRLEYVVYPRYRRLVRTVITNMIVFESIDPNKVLYQRVFRGWRWSVSARPAYGERWAGAGMSAGHPNSASPRSACATWRSRFMSAETIRPTIAT